MERRDILKDEIERVGRAIGKIIADLLGISNENIEEGIEKSVQTFKDELLIDLDHLLNLNPNNLPDYFNTKNLTPENLELIGDYFYTIAEQLAKAGKNPIEYLKKSLEIYEQVDRIGSMASFERMNKVSLIESKIARLKDEN